MSELEGGVTMLSVLTECCKELLESHELFWLLSMLSDTSYEEGDRNNSETGYRNYVDSWVAEGISPNLSEENLGVVSTGTYTKSYYVTPRSFASP